jgi:hypothetical protein
MPVEDRQAAIRELLFQNSFRTLQYGDTKLSIEKVAIAKAEKESIPDKI